ncbi:MAG: 3-deoxy-7-phosphoheptulonate synthase, partial [Verrucomicrobia bacterium]|nr:3-deoxy-7-phosphoheptulonate synthase [Verrucomicrobiota bacterium]
HLVMRGGRSGPNYQKHHIDEAAAAIARSGATPRIMVDCSHANSGKKPENQPVVWNDILAQRAASSAGSSPVFGAMIESFIEAGSQSIPADLTQLQYGVSVTDACLSWRDTEKLLLG